MKDFSKKYLEIIVKEFNGLNLTRITEPKEFHLKQYRDSILPLEISENFNEVINSSPVVLDVGFGGGFPLLPLASLFPEKKFVGIEARSKKSNAVSRIAEIMGISNVKTYHLRLEDLVIDKECVILSKAVADVSKLLPLVNSKKKIFSYFYKGANFKELEDYSTILNTWDLIEERAYSLDSGSMGRYLVGFKNKNVPCGTISKIKQGKIKLSTLI